MADAVSRGNLEITTSSSDDVRIHEKDCQKQIRKLPHGFGNKKCGVSSKNFSDSLMILRVGRVNKLDAHLDASAWVNKKIEPETQLRFRFYLVPREMINPNVQSVQM